MKYIIYCRKSSEDESHQVQSLETQIALLDEYSKKWDLNIVDRLHESRSARNDNHRPLFSSMIERIKKGEVEAILTAHIDGLSRNGMESALIIKLFEEGKLKEIRTPSKIYNSIQDLLYMDFDFVFASHYSRNLSIRVKEGIQTKLKKGEFPNRTPIGYFNKEGKIYPDPIYSLPVKRAFELYATGEYSLKQIVNKIYDEGLRSRGGQTIRKSTFERILKNPIYIGIVRVNGKNYKGIHEPIISQELFDTVQNINKLVSRPRFRKHVYLYRGYATCEDCGCLITASTKAKRNPKEYVYYYCTNGKFICDQHKKYIRGDKMQTLVQNIFDDISGCMDSEIAQLSLESYYQSIKDEVGFEEQTKTNLDFQIKRNKGKQDTLLDLLLEGKIVQETYDTKLSILKAEEKELIKQQTNFKPQDPDVTLELLNSFKTEAISLKKVFSEGDDEVKKDLLNSALWNFSVKDGKVANVRYKTLYEKLSKTAKSADLNSWLGDRDLRPDTGLQRAVSYC